MKIYRSGFIVLIMSIIITACGNTFSTATFDSDPIQAFQQLETALPEANESEQNALIQAFLERFPESPVVSGNTALFIYQAEAEQRRIALTGDMTGWVNTIPMQQLGATNTWALTQTFPIAARIDYRFGIGSGGGLAVDPRNESRIPGSFGNSSELQMPEYIAPQEIIKRDGVPEGTLENLGMYFSEISQTTHELVVYLPPGYDKNKTYPSVYFQDGDDYRRFASTPTIFDNAIADGILPPLIGVFVTPSREQGRQTDYNLNAAYSEFFATELVALIDSKYPTSQNPAERIVVGDSFGGLISLYIAVVYPDVFGGVVSHSGFVSRYGDRLISLYAVQNLPNVRIDIVIGTYETCIFGIVTGDDCNFLEGNRTLRDVLQNNSYTYRYNEYPQGHSWGFWRDYIDENIAWALNWNQ